MRFNDKVLCSAITGNWECKYPINWDLVPDLIQDELIYVEGGDEHKEAVIKWKDKYYNVSYYSFDGSVSFLNDRIIKCANGSKETECMEVFPVKSTVTVYKATKGEE